MELLREPVVLKHVADESETSIVDSTKYNTTPGEHFPEALRRDKKCEDKYFKR